MEKKLLLFFAFIFFFGIGNFAQSMDAKENLLQGEWLVLNRDDDLEIIWIFQDNNFIVMGKYLQYNLCRVLYSGTFKIDSENIFFFEKDIVVTVSYTLENNILYMYYNGASSFVLQKIL